MHQSLASLLTDPRDQSPLQLTVDQSTPEGKVASGWLSSPRGGTYPVSKGIPRFAILEDAGQHQTEESFGYKWNRRDSFDSPAMVQNMRNWLVEKYGFKDAAAMRDYFASRKRILDAGCGAALSSSTFVDEEWRKKSESNQTEWCGVDISTAIDVAQARLGSIDRTHFVQADLLALPFRPGTFDTIFSEGVLHHTPSTKKALQATASLLAPGGEFLFYVYRKKGPIREFTDDYIRDEIADMDPNEAWESLRPLTELGQALAELKVDVTVPSDVPLLGIKAGKIDIQRFIYWNVAKMFWNPDLTFEENHHINFDWYHPRYAHRQTEAEVRQWCGEAGLTVTYLKEEEAGLTVRANKN